MFERIPEARKHANKTHVLPMDQVVIYPWTYNQADTIATRDRTIFLHKVSPRALPPLEGYVIKIGDNALDPFGSTMVGPDYPYQMPQDARQDKAPFPGSEMPIGIRLPPAPKKMPRQRAFDTCQNPGCYVICATAALEAIQQMSHLAFAKHKQRRAVNPGQDFPAPTPRQLREIRLEYENAFDPALGPHYLSTR